MYQWGFSRSLPFTRSSVNLYYFYSFQYCVVVLTDGQSDRLLLENPNSDRPVGRVCYLAKYVHKKDDYSSFRVLGCAVAARDALVIGLPPLKIVSVRVNKSDDPYFTYPQTLLFDFAKLELPSAVIFGTCSPIPMEPAPTWRTPGTPAEPVPFVCLETSGLFRTASLTRKETLACARRDRPTYVHPKSGAAVIYNALHPGAVQFLENSVYMDSRLQGLFDNCPAEYITGLESVLLELLKKYLAARFKEGIIKNPTRTLGEGDFGPITESILSITFPLFVEFGFLDGVKADFFIDKVGYRPIYLRSFNNKGYFGDFGDISKVRVDGISEIYVNVIECLELFIELYVMPEISVNGDPTSFLKKDRKVMLQNLALTIEHALVLCVKKEIDLCGWGC